LSKRSRPFKNFKILPTGNVLLHTDALKLGGAGFCRAAAIAILASLAACSTMGSGGPTSASIGKADGVVLGNAQIRVIDVTDAVARRVSNAQRMPLLSEVIGDAAPTDSVIGRGDLLSVTIWEAPPAVLFGGSSSFGGGGTGTPTGTVVSQNSAIPEMMVDESGRIRLPFVGAVRAAGLTPPQVEREIAARLRGMAHQPQVSVRIAQNVSSTVAVVGDVKTSGRIPITPRGERLLDAIAAAGGTSEPIGKISVQVSREGREALVPLESVIRNPNQNIRLGPNDVVTVLFQPFKFTALGATSTSAEIPFESTGITLAEALGRVGGLKDERANVRGAFVFRYEDPAALDPAIAAASPRTPDGRVPVIYRVDLRNPATLFAAQNFPMRNKDILYVSTAPLSDLQRFVSILSSMAFTFIGLGQAVP
jgi:polysaccharide biosynthesis/export protein